MVKVKDLMSRHIVGVSKTTTVESARKLMKSMHVELMPVISEGRLCGIVIDSDIAYCEGNEAVGHIMRKPQFAEADSDSTEAAKKMVENAFPRLPVVDSRRNMHCIGIVSSTDIVKSSK